MTHKYAERLAPILSFQSDVFRRDEQTPQELCDLVIALALAYNDIRDAYSAHVLLNEVQPTDSRPSQLLGESGGQRILIKRVVAGFVHELLGLIRSSRDVINSPAFQKLAKSLSKPGKEAWSSLQTAAFGGQEAAQTVKSLAILRNKIAFHYDAERLGASFHKRFSRPEDRPMFSHGRVMAETRFYFADAAAQAFLEGDELTAGAREVHLGSDELMTDINLALEDLVTKFVNGRALLRDVATDHR